MEVELEIRQRLIEGILDLVRESELIGFEYGRSDENAEFLVETMRRMENVRKKAVELVQGLVGHAPFITAGGEWEYWKGKTLGQYWEYHKSKASEG